MLHSWLRMMLKHRRDRNDRRDCLFIDVEDKIQPYTTRNHQCGYFDLTCTKCQLLCCSLLHHCHWDLPPLRQLMVSWSPDTNYHQFINKFVSLSFPFFYIFFLYLYFIFLFFPDFLLLPCWFCWARELLGQHHRQSFSVHPVCFRVHKIAISFRPAAPCSSTSFRKLCHLPFGRWGLWLWRDNVAGLTSVHFSFWSSICKFSVHRNYNIQTN